MSKLKASITLGERNIVRYDYRAPKHRLLLRHRNFTHGASKNINCCEIHCFDRKGKHTNLEKKTLPFV